MNDYEPSVGVRKARERVLEASVYLAQQDRTMVVRMLRRAARDVERDEPGIADLLDQIAELIMPAIPDKDQGRQLKGWMDP